MKSKRQLLLRLALSHMALMMGLGACATAAHAQTLKAKGAALKQTVRCQTQPQINTTGRTIELIVPVREMTPLGDLAMRIGPDDTITFRVADLSAALRRVVRPEQLQALEALAAQEGYARLADAATAGFPLTFDPASLDLRVEIAPESRISRAIGFAFDDIADAQVNATPSAFSVYANYRLSLDYDHVGADAGFRGARSYIDLDGRLGPIAFENQLDLDSERDPPFVRNASRIIYDQIDTGIRWSLGDLRYDQTFFQSAPDIAGLGASKGVIGQFGGRNIAATTTRSVTLRRPSTVEVRVNGVLVRQLQLGPGTYQLQDLPLADGASFIELTIIDDLGEREQVQFSLFSDSTLLAPGESEFSTAAGILAPREQDGPSYRSDQYAFSGYYRRGITDRLTLEVDAQGTEAAQLVGAGAIVGTNFGLFTLHASSSSQDVAGSGYAARVEYFWQDGADSGRPRVFAAAVETRSENFGGIEELGPSNPYEITAMARYTQPIGPDLSASFGGDYFVSRTSDPDRYAASAFLTWNALQNTSLTFGVIFDQDPSGEDEINALLSLTQRIGQRQTLTASAQTRDNRYQAGYARSPRYRIDDWGFSANAFSDDDATAVSANAVYYTNRGNLEVAHTTSMAPNSSDITAQTTSARVSGAVAFAGNNVGLGQPIYDSFALVSGHPTLEGRPVLLRDPRMRERERARSGALGPAVSTLSSYSVQTLPYDVEDLPAGYNLGEGLFTVAPPLHSGYDLTVGSAYNVTVVGVLLNRNGEPVSLMGGMAVSADDPDAPRVQIFTNRTGRFGASGLAPGIWRLTLNNDLNYTIRVTDDQGSYVRLPPQLPDPAN